jgi:predicted phage terminase large subunit-like protein
VKSSAHSESTKSSQQDPRESERIDLVYEGAVTELCERRLYDFAKSAWRVVEPGTPFVDGWHIGAICEHLEAVTDGEIKNLVVSVPPRSMKSYLIDVFWPAWLWLSNAAVRWLFFSCDQDLSTRDSLRTRDVIVSRWYQQRWGSRWRLKQDQNEKTQFANTKTGYRYAFPVGGGMGHGGDVIVGDDLHKPHEVWSTAKREYVIRCWSQTIAQRVTPSSRKVLAGQRTHHEDVIAHALGQGGWTHLNIPEEYEVPPMVQVTSIGWRDPRSKPKELMWPDQRPQAFVDQQKTIAGPYGWAAQFQQRPAPIEGGIFKRAWLRFWQPKGSNLPPVRIPAEDGGQIELPIVTLPEGLLESQSWDCAFKDTKTSSYVVGQTWGQSQVDSFLLDQVRGHLDFMATLEAVRSMSARWPNAVRKLIEDKANGTAVIGTLRKELAGIEPHSPTDSKEGRAQAVVPYVSAGNVYLPHPAIAPWVWDFIEELATFPNSAFDDQVDAMTQYLYTMRRRLPATVGAMSVGTVKRKKW